MNKRIALATLTLFLATTVATVRAATHNATTTADVAADKPSDGKVTIGKSHEPLPKNAFEPVETSTRPHGAAIRNPGAKPVMAPTPEATPAPRKKHKGLFDDDALHKDRSRPANDKVPMTDDKPRTPPYKTLNQDLHKDRG